jgi:fructuronate reductase
VTRVLREEYLPTVAVPTGVDVEAYVGQLFVRWSNSALGHRTSQVGSDGSAKLAQRIPEPALTHLAAGRMPHHLALTVAAYLCCVAPPPGFPPGPQAKAMTDPARESLTPLAAHEGFTNRVAELVEVLVKYGPEAAIQEAAVEGRGA